MSSSRYQLTPAQRRLFRELQTEAAAMRLERNIRTLPSAPTTTVTNVRYAALRPGMWNAGVSLEEKMRRIQSMQRQLRQRRAGR